MIKFQSACEAQAWAAFFAAQCPKISNVAAKNLSKEIEAAEAAADLMLHSWRERCEQEPEPEYCEPEPAQEEPGESEGNADHGTCDGDNYR